MNFTFTNKLIRIKIFSLALAGLLYIGISPAWSLFSFLGYIPFINLAYFWIGLLLLYFVITFIEIYYRNGKIKLVSYCIIAGYLLLSYIIVVQLIWFPYIATTLYEGFILFKKTVLTTIFGSLLFWLLGVNFHYIAELLEVKSCKILVMGVYIIYLVAVMLSIITGAGGFPTSLNQWALPAQINGNLLPNYIGLADTFAVFSMVILILFLKEKENISIVFMFISIIFLFAMYSRTSFYLYILALIPFVWKRIGKLKMVCTILLAFLLISYNSDLFYQSFQSNRITRILSNLEEDSSYNARKELFEIGLNDLRNNIILGHFLVEAIEGRKGGYIHNYLSFWVSYGVFPFLAFLTLALLSLLKTVKIYLSCNNEEVVFVTSYSVFAFLAIILSRSYVWPYIWFCLSSPHVLLKHNTVLETIKIKS